MIIVGYQGIGKSTLSNMYDKYIDLESSNFFVDGERDTNWYKVYANMANDLSKQGNTVFTSSHECVRNELKKSDELVVVCFPSLEIKDDWLEKLRYRYEKSGLEKDKKAYMYAEKMYDESIKDMMESGFDTIEITDANYDLSSLINKFMKKRFTKKVEGYKKALEECRLIMKHDKSYTYDKSEYNYIACWMLQLCLNPSLWDSTSSQEIKSLDSAFLFAACSELTNKYKIPYISKNGEKIIDTDVVSRDCIIMAKHALKFLDTAENWQTKHKSKRNADKYEVLRDEENTQTTESGIVIHRIRALKDFVDVKEGDLGGWVQGEHNLSQDGNCWIYDDSKVFDAGFICDNAQIRSGSLVYGWAAVYGNSIVKEKSRIYGYAEVSGNSTISGESSVFDHARVSTRHIDKKKVNV